MGPGLEQHLKGIEKLATVSPEAQELYPAQSDDPDAPEIAIQKGRCPPPHYFYELAFGRMPFFWAWCRNQTWKSGRLISDVPKYIQFPDGAVDDVLAGGTGRDSLDGGLGDDVLALILTVSTPSMHPSRRLPLCVMQAMQRSILGWRSLEYHTGRSRRPDC